MKALAAFTYSGFFLCFLIASKMSSSIRITHQFFREVVSFMNSLMPLRNSGSFWASFSLAQNLSSSFIYSITAKKYLKFSLVLLLLIGTALATHNPSVSHSTLVNSAFLNDYSSLEVRL